jgi:hypothetical protein
MFTIVFHNLSPKLILGFQHRDNSLHVFLSSAAAADQVLMEVKCVDAGKAKELLAAGIGACVSLYNVKVKMGAFGELTLLVTVNSGIRLFEFNKESKKVSSTAIEELRPVKKPLTAIKWTCLVCGFRNYASKTVCFSCDQARKKGQTNHFCPAGMCKVRPTHLVPGPVSIALLAKTLSAMIIAGNATYVGQRSPKREQETKVQ